MTDTTSLIAELTKAKAVFQQRAILAAMGVQTSDIGLKPPKCGGCGKRDTLPSENPKVWYCANCLEQVRLP